MPKEMDGRMASKVLTDVDCVCNHYGESMQRLRRDIAAHFGMFTLA